MKTSAKFLILPLAIGALLVGCGGDDSSDDSTDTGSSATQTEQPAGNTGNANAGKAEVLSLAADPSGALAYDKTELSGKAGKIAIDFTNESPVGHDVVITDADGTEVASTPVITGQSASTEFDAKAGSYTFFCSLPGHEEAGMKGTLTVN